MTTDMTPKERIGAFLTGKPIDHVPCVPLILNHCARVLGVTVKEYATDGEVMGRANVAAFRRYGQDLITIFADTSILAEAMGTELHYPDDDVPRVKTPVVNSMEDAEKLEVPDARTAGRLCVYLEAVRHCVREVGDEVFVSVCYPSPFSTAAGLRGTAMLARDLIKRPDLANLLLDKSAQLVEDFAEAVAEAGGIPALVDPVATGSILSRKAFEEFALPGNRRCLARIASLKMPPILHICGRISHTIDLMAASGAAVLSVDQIDLLEAKAKVGDKVCLMGNVRPTETLLEGTPDDVRAEAAKCLADCKDSPGGFILASGCEVPLETPPENIFALIETARRNGGS
ncbi:MAG TPA: uroporphyrinogen decarboxylase family protein [Planctomycetota bacterium]|nr:uroporphyrinogen decarboxylase family protein [Planctomycetota bacterium]